MQYEKIKKLMGELDHLSDSFNSVILAHDSTLKNNITSLQLDQSDKTNKNHNNMSSLITRLKWGFVLDKDLSHEKEKLLAYVTR